MLGTMLDVAIGLVTFFFLISVAVTAAREMIESVVRSRGATLRESLGRLLGADGAAALYTHPLIRGLHDLRSGDGPLEGSSRTPGGLVTRIRARRRLPSYIPNHLFALAAYDIALREGMADGRSATLLDAAIGRTTQASLPDPEHAHSVLEEAYRGAMDRASGRYRRQTQWIVLLVALVVTVGLNADALAIARHLYDTPAARQALAARAAAITSGTDSATRREFAVVRAQIDSLALPIGWPRAVDTGPEVVDEARRRFVGWLVTVLAASLGAPFWFDVLNRFMVVRSTVKPAEKSGEEGSEDRRSVGDGRVASLPRAPTWTPLPLARGAVPATTTRPGPTDAPEGEAHAAPG